MLLRIILILIFRISIDLKTDRTLIEKRANASCSSDDECSRIAGGRHHGIEHERMHKNNLVATVTFRGAHDSGSIFGTGWQRASW